ncbi:hypothetical protein MJO29_011775 [Puccinia striiformis f. sp. tritici]|nr:hypothetical protein MJO29_011775 [Puccinia striiformis f. sp. tritici]
MVAAKTKGNPIRPSNGCSLYTLSIFDFLLLILIVVGFPFVSLLLGLGCFSLSKYPRSTPIHPSPILDTQAQQVSSSMSRPEAVSRNPFMPPPNTVTFSASSWATTQALTFNVLFSIIDQNRHSAEGDFAPSSPSSDDGLWPPSDRPWTSSSSFSQSTDTGNSQLDADHLHQYNIDQILNSLGNALSAFSLSLHQTISTCGMCLEDYQSDDLVLVLPCHSSHFFHRHCLRDWFKEYINCPLCRKKFDPN